MQINSKKFIQVPEYPASLSCQHLLQNSYLEGKAAPMAPMKINLTTEQCDITASKMN